MTDAERIRYLEQIIREQNPGIDDIDHVLDDMKEETMNSYREELSNNEEKLNNYVEELAVINAKLNNPNHYRVTNGANEKQEKLRKMEETIGTENDVLRGEISEIDKQLEETREKLNSETEAANSLNERISELNNEAGKALSTVEFDKIQDQIDEANKELRSHQRKMVNANNKVNNLETSKARLQNKINNYETRLSNLRSSIETNSNTEINLSQRRLDEDVKSSIIMSINALNSRNELLRNELGLEPKEEKVDYTVDSMTVGNTTSYNKPNVEPATPSEPEALADNEYAETLNPELRTEPETLSNEELQAQTEENTTIQNENEEAYAPMVETAPETLSAEPTVAPETPSNDDLQPVGMQFNNDGNVTTFQTDEDEEVYAPIIEREHGTLAAEQAEPIAAPENLSNDNLTAPVPDPFSTYTGGERFLDDETRNKKRSVIGRWLFVKFKRPDLNISLVVSEDKYLAEYLEWKDKMLGWLKLGVIGAGVVGMGVGIGNAMSQTEEIHGYDREYKTLNDEDGIKFTTDDDEKENDKGGKDNTQNVNPGGGAPEAPTVPSEPSGPVDPTPEVPQNPSTPSNPTPTEPGDPVTPPNPGPAPEEPTGPVDPTPEDLTFNVEAGEGFDQGEQVDLNTSDQTITVEGTPITEEQKQEEDITNAAINGGQTSDQGLGGLLEEISNAIDSGASEFNPSEELLQTEQVQDNGIAPTSLEEAPATDLNPELSALLDQAAGELTEEGTSYTR